jgi:NAD(P)-dependent dehydrogenase (short-subunit alcohol dehydrogenase family)
MASARIAVVTGANRGLGRTVAERLTDEGWSVIAVCRRLEDARGAVKDKVAAHSACLDAGRRSSETRAAVESCAQQVLEASGGRPLDLLINNAGVFLDPWTREDFDEAMAVNVAAPVFLTRALAPHFSDAARVVNVSSGYGALDGLAPDYRAALARAETDDDILGVAFDGRSPMGTSTKPTYRVTKATLNRWTRAVAATRAGGSFSCAAVCPGMVQDTDGGRRRHQERGAGRGIHIGARARAGPDKVRGHALSRRRGDRLVD